MPLNPNWSYDPKSDPWAENEDVGPDGRVREVVPGAEPLSQTRADIQARAVQDFIEEQILKLAKESLRAEPQAPPEPEQPIGPKIRPRGWRMRKIE